MKEITWRPPCAACGENRPYRLISVLTIPLVIAGQKCGNQNYNYCNDSEECRALAEKWEGHLPRIPEARVSRLSS